MPSVLAIVAKAAFEPLDKQHGPIAPGKVLPLTEYLSQNRALSGLAEGGSILLVTVRPPGERLWLLAVLEEPRSDGTKWSAAANAVPVRDVTDLIPRLRFSTGKGISAKPGALGMSLQTPRTLTDEDEALLRGTTGGVAAPEAGATVRERKPVEAAPKASGAAPSASTAREPPLATLIGWLEADDDARQRALEEAAVSLSGFKVGAVRQGRLGLGTLIHEASGTELVAVPGGVFYVGFSLDDVLAIARLVDAEEYGELEGLANHARPLRPVRVKPFLFAKQIAKAPLALPFRLPSEAEWEWVAREGGTARFVSVVVHSPGPQTGPFAAYQAAVAELRKGQRKKGAPKTAMDLDIDFERNGFGVADLLNEPENQVADSWHDTYDGAPETSAAWEPGGTPGVVRYGHTAFQGNSEVVALHAAYRERGTGAPRAALDLPIAAISGAPLPGVATTFAETLAAIGGSDKKARKLGLLALSLSAGERFRAEEAVALSAALLQLLPTLEKGDLAAFVETLGELAAGGLIAFGSAQREGKPRVPHAGVVAQLEAVNDKLLKLLASSDAKVRASATAPVAFLSGGRAALAELLKKEKKPEVRASALLGLAHVGEGAPARAALRDKDEFVRAAAGLGVALTDGLENASEALVSAMCQAISVGGRERVELPWFGGQLSPTAIRFVESAGPAVKSAAVKAMLAAAARETNPERVYPLQRLVDKAAALLFRPAEALDAAALTSEQRSFLEAISEGVLGHGGRELDKYGIPMGLGARRHWLGLDPPDVLDREIETVWDGKPRRWSLEQWANALMKRVRQEIDKPPENRAPGDELTWEGLSRAFGAEVGKLNPTDQLEARLVWPERVPRLLPEGVGAWKAAVAFDAARAKALLEQAKARKLRLSSVAGAYVLPHLIPIAMEALASDEHFELPLAKLTLGMAFGPLHVQVARALTEADRASYLLDAIAIQERFFAEAPKQASFYRAPDLIKGLAPLLPETPSNELARRAVRLAGASSARQETWAALEAVADRAPDVKRALEALGEQRKMGQVSDEAALEFYEGFHVSS